MSSQENNNYQLGSKNYTLNQPRYKLVEGWGAGATKELNVRTYISKAGNTYALRVYVKSSIASLPPGSLLLSGTVELVVDGRVKEKLYLRTISEPTTTKTSFDLGYVDFILPLKGRVEILTISEFSINTGAGSVNSANAIGGVNQFYKEFTGKLLWEDTILIYP